jgi:hypothetical protein
MKGLSRNFCFSASIGPSLFLFESTHMKKINRSVLTLVLSGPVAVLAAAFDGPDGNKFEITGFTKHEWSRNAAGARTVPDNLSAYTFDNRNALSKPDVDQTDRADRGSQLSMQQLSLGWSKETSGAVGLEAKLTYRWRSDDVLRLFKGPDVDYREAGGNLLGRDYTERFVGISRPDLGAAKVGTQLSRSWSRSDAFSFPIGLSGVWADSGAGYGIFPTALRLTSPVLEDGSGKLSFELTTAMNQRNTRLVDQNRTTGAPATAFSPNPTQPRAIELFLQYSNAKNLIELTVQSASGAKQTSFGKSALVGWIGDPDTLPGLSSTPRRAAAPSQSVVILQGNHWPDTSNMFTWGVRRSQWSGSAASCNYNVALANCVFGLDPGFNYGPASAAYLGYQATAYDAMLGWSHYRGLYTYTVGGVYFPRASSKNPIEWGQSNSAVHVNLGVARKVPEIGKGLTVTVGVARSQFQKIGPAPVSMPNNNFLSANPLYDRVGHSATMGLTWTF